jgi:hypothetical protein
MSEVEVNPVEELIDALAVQNFNVAKNHFDSILGDKVSDALEAEKIKVADTIFNGVEDEEQLELELDDEEVETEDSEEVDSEEDEEEEI